MTVLKLVVISLVVFFSIITIISLFIPSTVRISKARDINVPKDSVMKHLADTNDWKNWYPAPQPVMVVDSVNVNEVKFHYSQNDKNIPAGWKVLPVEGSSAVEWYLEFHFHWYPWEKFSSLVLEKRYGPALEQGLNDLKNYLENRESKK